MPGPIFAIHQQNVGVPIIVVVNKRAAWSHGFRQPLLSKSAIVVREVNPGLRGNVAEGLLRVCGDRQTQNPPHRHTTQRLFSVTLRLCGEMQFNGLPYFEPPASAAEAASPMCFGWTGASGTATCSRFVCRSLLSSGCFCR